MGKIFESTPAYQKGLIGEEIVKKYLESLENVVRRPDDTAKSGASVVDFVVEQIIEYENGKKDSWSFISLAEVKVKSLTDYAYGRFKVYMFPKTQIDLYKRYAKEKDLQIDIYIVDEQRESIFYGYTSEYNDGIEIPLKIEDKTFPLDVEQSNGLEMYHVYSIHQFGECAKIDFSDLERLRSIKFSNSDKKIFKPLQNSPKDISNDDLVKESRAVVLKYLDITLPEDIPTKNKKISTLVKSLRPKLNRIPTFLFYEIYHAVHNINMSKEIQLFVNQFYVLLDEIKHERQKTSYKIPDVIEIKTPAKKIAELNAPNNTLLEIFEVEGNNPRFFVETSNLRLASGDKSLCYFHHGICDTVKAVSHFYYLFGVSKSTAYDGKTLSVPLKDILVIVNEYSFNRVDEISEYDEAKTFLEWWEEVAEPYLEPPQEEKQEETQSKPKNNSFTDEDIQSIGKIADSIMEVMGTTRQNAIQAAIKIKSKELNMDLTPLIELLK